MISCSNDVNKFFENQRLMVLKYFWWTWVSGHEMSVKFILNQWVSLWFMS